MKDKERESLKKFFERHPHPPWMDDNRYFKNNEEVTCPNDETVASC